MGALTELNVVFASILRRTVNVMMAGLFQVEPEPQDLTESSSGRHTEEFALNPVDVEADTVYTEVCMLLRDQ
jgi:hypothetical protein